MGADVSKEAVPGQTEMLKALQTGASPIFIQGKGRKKGKKIQFLTYKGHIPIYAATLEELSTKYLNTVVPTVVPQATITQATVPQATVSEASVPQAINTNPAQVSNTNTVKPNNTRRNTSRRGQFLSGLSGFTSRFKGVGAEGTSSGAAARGIRSFGNTIGERMKTRHKQLNNSLKANLMSPVNRRAAAAEAARTAGQGAYAAGKVAGQGAYAAGKVAGQGAQYAAKTGYTLGKAGLGAAGRGLRAAGTGAQAVGVAGLIGAQAVGKSAYSGAQTLGKKASNAWSWMRGTRKNTRTLNQNSNKSPLVAAANQANQANTGTFDNPNASTSNNVRAAAPTGLSSNAQAIANSIEATPENVETGKGRVERKLAALRARQAVQAPPSSNFNIN